MKTWKVEFEISVSDNWILDGFDMKEREEQLMEFLNFELLPYSFENEVVTNKMKIDEIKKGN
jgi:hypothetical protein